MTSKNKVKPEIKTTGNVDLGGILSRMVKDAKAKPKPKRKPPSKGK